MAEQKQSRASELDGSAMTREMFLDSYMAGTSDGVYELAEGSIVIEPESYDADMSELAAERTTKP